jgi:hypothetical protein
MKFVSELICFIFILLAMSASSSVNAVPRTDMDELYSDSIYMPKSEGEIPTAFESSARDTEDADAVDYYSAASETVDLEPVLAEQPIHGKKLTSRQSRKKTSRN